MAGTIISNDRQAGEAASQLAAIDDALSSQETLQSLAAGLSADAIPSYRQSLFNERQELARRLDAYRRAKNGDLGPLRAEAVADLGSQLIVARIGQNLTQKDLARKLGLQEQAIQRYEAERYRSISLAGFQKIAAVLNVRLAAEPTRGVGNEWGFHFEVDHTEVSKVVKHARTSGWIDRSAETFEEARDELKRAIGEHLLKHGKPSLLRTGLGVHHRASDLAVVAWKAQVARRAEQQLKSLKAKFRVTRIDWLQPLARMSANEEKLRLIPDFLAEHGIIMICERAVPGMKVDGASFLIDEVPVIGLTLTKDTIDGFWFTLFHELAHVFLHYRTGLQSGFFDDVDAGSLNNVEQEANNFAATCLIPNELWIKSPARIAKTHEPIQNLARQLGIHPAIAFGRVRKERDDYKIFSDRIGQGRVRLALLNN